MCKNVCSSVCERVYERVCEKVYREGCVYKGNQPSVTKHVTEGGVSQSDRARFNLVFPIPHD